ncbi:MAG: EscU/YscU/HrcU family type III secretion system export apparatus switch protein [Clostridiales bacterium]|nr:EscU/YscU/HrcU family type III secretion system export apparatus switch protein [Clostridiales bacterium]
MSKYKKNKAVALKYNVEEDASPVVIASGYGTVAEHIIDIAEKKGIPVFKDDSAASLLCMLEVGSNIPVELYEVVAAIYCKLIETSASIRGAETAAEAAAQVRGKESGAGERLRRNLASGKKNEESAK